MPNNPSHISGSPHVETAVFVAPVRKRPLKQRLQSLIRWLHIYSSLLGFMTVLFFGITGLTLNHPQWFDSGYQAVREESGSIDRSLIETTGAEPDKLAIVEFIRSKYDVRAAVRDFQFDEYQINISFAGPGYTADVSIDRQTSDYQFNELRLGITAIINDLHKGRDTGTVWSIFIDISAILLVFISISGVLLLVWLKRLWRSGLYTIIAGTLLIIVLTWVSLP